MWKQLQKRQYSSKVVFALFILWCAVVHTAHAQVTELLYSLSSTRSPSQLLNGSTISGPIYVFTALSNGTVAGTPPVSSVTYNLDNGVFAHTENFAPFDFNGTVYSYTFPVGSHVIKQVVTFTDGTKETDTASFTMSSGRSYSTNFPLAENPISEGGN